MKYMCKGGVLTHDVWMAGVGGLHFFRMPWEHAAAACLGSGQVPRAMVWALPDWGDMLVPRLCVAVAVNWLLYLQTGRCQVVPWRCPSLVFSAERSRGEGWE